MRTAPRAASEETKNQSRRAGAVAVCASEEWTGVTVAGKSVNAAGAAQ